MIKTILILGILFVSILGSILLFVGKKVTTTITNQGQEIYTFVKSTIKRKKRQLHT